MFYISAFFEARRDEYYERLLAVSRDSDWTGWSQFFLEGIRSQAEDNLAKVTLIQELYQRLKLRLPEAIRSHYARVLEWIFSKPVFSSSDFVRGSGIPLATARRILRALQDEDVLSQLVPGSGRRSGVLIFWGFAMGHRGQNLRLRVTYSQQDDLVFK
jgi:Fic family protein